MEAAIYATSCLTRHSATFAAGICEKIAATVQGPEFFPVHFVIPFHSIPGLAVPVDMKLRLIPILSQMHHNITTATQVKVMQKALCCVIVCMCRCESCVCSCYPPTLPSPSSPPPSTPSLSSPWQPRYTFLIRSLFEAHYSSPSPLSPPPPPPPPLIPPLPVKVWLLLSYAASDARERVRLFALRELMQLATHTPHMWTTDMTQVTTAYQTMPLSATCRPCCHV